MSDSLQPHRLQHTRPPCPSPAPEFTQLVSIESVIPSSHLILCHPLLLPSIFPRFRIFSSESVFGISWPSIGASASASVIRMNIQDWFPLGLTGLISLHPKYTIDNSPFYTHTHTHTHHVSFIHSAIVGYLGCFHVWGFHGASNSKEPAFNSGDLGSIAGSGRSAGEGNSNLLQYCWSSLVT